MNKQLLRAACLVAAASAAPAQALMLEDLVLNGNDNNGVLIQAPNVLGVDLGLRNLQPATATFRLERGDPTMFSFSSILANLSGQLWGSITYSLGGGAFFSAVPGTPSGFGSVTPEFGVVSSVIVNPPVDPTSQMIVFTRAGEPSGVSVGDPFLLGGSLLDWQISVGRMTGDTFTLTVEAAPIPVPGAVLLLGSGLIGLFGFVARRRVTTV